MKVSALFQNQNATVVGPDVDVTALVYDSRRVQPGALFAAWSGEKVDAHVFIEQAIQKGARAILCERVKNAKEVTFVQVADSRWAFAQAARVFFGDPAAALCMVGVTGTNGKTTTVHLLEGMLKAANKTPAVLGTLGIEFQGQRRETGLTTQESSDLVETLANLRSQGCDAVAMEVSSHALQMHRVAGVTFDVGLFTNLTHDHLDLHKTMENYFAAKSRLKNERLKSAGVAVLNCDDPWVLRLMDSKSLGFSAHGHPAAQVRLEKLRLTADGINMQVQTPRGTLEIQSALLGSFNVSNLLGAIAVGEALNLSHQHVADGLGHVRAVQGRLQRVSQDKEPLVVVDYAHTPDALEKALYAVRDVTKGRLVCVFGCGGDRDPHKRRPMGEIAAKLADCVVVTNDNPRSEDPRIISEAIVGGLRFAGLGESSSISEDGFVVELDRRTAIQKAVGAAGPDDAVLIAGKGHETYQLIGGQKLHFDDRQVAREILDGRPSGTREEMRHV